MKFSWNTELLDHAFKNQTGISEHCKFINMPINAIKLSDVLPNFTIKLTFLNAFCLYYIRAFDYTFKGVRVETGYTL